MNFLLFYLLLAISFKSCYPVHQGLNLRPIIGILTQPTGSSLKKFGHSYIAASYVKYVESSGARVVPIFHNSTADELDWIFDRINGVLFPGGGADLSPNTKIFQAGQQLYNRALDANDNEDIFPIFGHCMGFELLALITSEDPNILSSVDAENITLPLNFTSHAKSSRWLGNAPQDIIDILSHQPVTMNNHVDSVSPQDYHDNEYLPNFYSVLSTNVDRKGKEFISLWEGRNYPIYGMQWHAEKPLFEWDPNEVINHSPDSIRAMQYFSNFLVSSARRNMHHFDNYNQEYKNLIYNYNVLYSEALTGDFEQCYVF